MAAKAAPSALVVATRAADGGCSPGHVPAPQCPTVTEDGQDRGRARKELHGYAPKDAPPHPAPLLEVLPQERVQQRTVEQIVDPVPLVPLLHDVVPQMVEQLVDFLSPLDFRIAEQVIEVPKIVCPPRAARTVSSAPQTVEQLVEVPTPVSYSSLLQRTMEQHVVIPVPLGRGGRNADLQRFSPWTEFNSTAVFFRTLF